MNASATHTDPFPLTLMDAVTLARWPGALLVVDCRHDLADPAAGARAYAAGHLPAAVHADLDRDLSDLTRSEAGLGRHPLPAVSDFARTLARWGWHPGLPVVTYDAHGGALGAARLWWMLRALQQPAAVLDGGLPAWLAAGLPLETTAPARVTQTPTPLPDFPVTAVADTVELQRHLQAGSARVVDARAPERYRGEVEPIDPVAGHIPGARNRPYAQNLQADGRFKPAAQLRAEWQALLAGLPPAQVLHSCGSGVSACHNLLAMEHAGLRGSRLYAPSWSGWVSDRARPVARGSD